MTSITIGPTQEFFDAPVNGVKVPTRVWSGTTDSGIKIEAYVISIVPEDSNNRESADALRQWAVNAGMSRSRDVYKIEITG